MTKRRTEELLALEEELRKDINNLVSSFETTHGYMLVKAHVKHKLNGDTYIGVTIQKNRSRKRYG